MARAVAVEGIAAANHKDEVSGKLRALAGGAARNAALTEYNTEMLGHEIAQAQEID